MGTTTAYRYIAESVVRQAVQIAEYDTQGFGLDGDGQPVIAAEVDARTARGMVKAPYRPRPRSRPCTRNGLPRSPALPFGLPPVVGELSVDAAPSFPTTPPVIDQEGPQLRVWRVGIAEVR